jgi:hypothetical protein
MSDGIEFRNSGPCIADSPFLPYKSALTPILFTSKFDDIFTFSTLTISFLQILTSTALFSLFFMVYYKNETTPTIGVELIAAIFRL